MEVGEASWRRPPCFLAGVWWGEKQELKEAQGERDRAERLQHTQPILPPRSTRARSRFQQLPRSALWPSPFHR